MNAFCLLALTFMQCPIDSQSVYSGDYENIHFSGAIYSKQYVIAIIDDGSRVQIPVINGYLPTFDAKVMPNGRLRRDYYYGAAYKHNGSLCVEYERPPTKKVGKAYDEGSPPKKIEMPSPEIDALRETVSELTFEVQQLKQRLKKEPSDSKKIEAPSIKMKKPSEF